MTSDDVMIPIVMRSMVLWALQIEVDTHAAAARFD